MTLLPDSTGTKANLYATIGPRDRPGVLLSGHTDVVPVDGQNWHHPPFALTEADGRLYGRGTADMKGFVAAATALALTAAGRDLKTPLHLAFSHDEEVGCLGVRSLIDLLAGAPFRPAMCIVGEPTSVERTGDMIKNGRRGTMSGKLTVKGIQGHIAYPQLARNPIHMAAPALAELATTVWDKGNDFFPPTSWQVSNIHGGTGASNVIPGTVVIDFNFRFCPESTTEQLQRRVTDVLARHGLQDGTDYELQWTVGGLPFQTPPGALVDAVRDAIRDETGLTPELSTSGGTSDGRFIAQICPQVVELGPPNASIHKVNEHVIVSEVEPFNNIYRRALERLDQKARS